MCRKSLVAHATVEHGWLLCSSSAGRLPLSKPQPAGRRWQSLDEAIEVIAINSSCSFFIYGRAGVLNGHAN